MIRDPQKSERIDFLLGRLEVKNFIGRLVSKQVKSLRARITLMIRYASLQSFHILKNSDSDHYNS